MHKIIDRTNLDHILHKKIFAKETFHPHKRVETGLMIS